MAKSTKPGRKKKSPVPTNPVPEKDQTKQREQITLDMTRSVVTEPLLSRVKAAKPDQTFDVIISLNELFSGGVEAAIGKTRPLFLADCGWKQFGGSVVAKGSHGQ